MEKERGVPTEEPVAQLARKTLKQLGAPIEQLEELDDDGLLPMPKYIHGFSPSDTMYEPYLLRLIVMASVALDNLFVRKLRSALEALGDPTKTVVADREVRIHGSGGALLLTITRAPVKSRARMLNKLESAEDHRDKPLPRPKFNVDTVRAGIVVEDAGMMAAVRGEGLRYFARKGSADTATPGHRPAPTPMALSSSDNLRRCWDQTALDRPTGVCNLTLPA